AFASSRRDPAIMRKTRKPRLRLQAILRSGPRFVKGVVPSDADYQVSSITGQPAQLTAYLTDYGAIPGEQCGLTALRQHLSQLAHNVGISVNIGGVVENGIAKQDDVYHCEGLRITSFRHVGVRARSQQQGAPRECCHKVSGQPRHLSPSCCAFRFPTSFRKVLDEGG